MTLARKTGRILFTSKRLPKMSRNPAEAALFYSNITQLLRDCSRPPRHRLQNRTFSERMRYPG
jgi:hypothetical protein